MVTQELKEVFKARYHLSDEAVSLLFSQMEQVSFAKKEMIQAEGKTNRYLYFVERGIIRSFIQRDGRDLTLSIVSEGQTPLSSAGLTRICVAGVSINASTDCVLWRLSRTRLGELCQESLTFANFARELAEQILSDMEIYWTDYYSLDKKAQYRLLMRQQPELFRLIPLNEIASYLNVTPQSLSRIRASLD